MKGLKIPKELTYDIDAQLKKLKNKRMLPPDFLEKSPQKLFGHVPSVNRISPIAAEIAERGEEEHRYRRPRIPIPPPPPPPIIKRAPKITTVPSTPKPLAIVNPPTAFTVEPTPAPSTAETEAPSPIRRPEKVSTKLKQKIKELHTPAEIKKTTPPQTHFNITEAKSKFQKKPEKIFQGKKEDILEKPLAQLEKKLFEPTLQQASSEFAAAAKKLADVAIKQKEEEFGEQTVEERRRNVKGRYGTYDPEDIDPYSESIIRDSLDDVLNEELRLGYLYDYEKIGDTPIKDMYKSFEDYSNAIHQQIRGDALEKQIKQQEEYERKGIDKVASVKPRELWSGGGNRPWWYKKFGIPPTKTKIDSMIHHALNRNGVIYNSHFKRKIFGPNIKPEELNELTEIIIKKPKQSGMKWSPDVSPELTPFDTPKESSEESSRSGSPSRAKSEINLEEEIAAQEALQKEYISDTRDFFYKTASMSIDDMIRAYPKYENAIRKQVRRSKKEGKDDKQVKNDVSSMLRDRIYGKLLF